ncbi:MAG: hypothetical protein JSS50_03475, partial [Proteobacteria bacterium]|nr:hypothetical protein [Pseudomonadota bacterium]
MKNFMEENWHYAPLLLGLSLIATGAILANANIEYATLTVGTSNLSMVLALSGSALLLTSMIMWFKKSAVKYVSYGTKPTELCSTGAVIATIGLLATGYYATHIHIANTWLAGLNVWDSLGAQSLGRVLILV